MSSLDGPAALLTVMIVDDHPIWRDGLARDLTENGCTVMATAADPGAAVRIAPLSHRRSC